MRVFPDGAEEKLGFLLIRDRLESYVLGAGGADAVRALRPTDEMGRVRTELRRVSEIQSMFSSGERLGLDPIPDIRTVVHDARPEGAVLPVDSLQAVADQAAVARTWRDFFSKRSSDYPQIASIARTLYPLQELVRHIVSIIDPEGGVRDQASPELKRIRTQMRRKAASVRKVVQVALKDAEAAGYAAGDQPTIREGRLVIPVTADAKRAVGGIIQATSATGQTVFVEPVASMELNNEIRLLGIQENREIRRILAVATDKVRSAADELEQNHGTLTRLDVLQAKARVARDMDATAPELNGEGRLHIERARNPVLLLSESFREKDKRTIVPVDIELGVNYDTIVISGPNAGGKTVTMKTVGLLCLMLGYGMPVPVAEGSEMALFDTILVDIGDEQSIERDLSTFGSHVQNLSQIVRRAAPGALVLIDEAGTATDPSHGAAIARAVIEHVTERGARSIVTTHHGALKAFAQGSDRVVNAALHFDSERLEPTFVFRTGVPGSSYAFEVASRKGLPSAILDRARELLAAGETRLDELVAQLEDQRIQLLRAQTSMDAEAGRIENLMGELERERSDFENKRDGMLREAEADAEQLMKEANRVIEQTIREIKESQAERSRTRESRRVFEEEREKVQKRARQRKKADAPRRPDPAIRGVPDRDREIRVGDRVVLDEANTPGEVIELKGKQATVAFGSVTTRVPRTRLTRVGAASPQKVTYRKVGAGSVAEAKSVIDVRGLRVNEALRLVSKSVDRALLAGLRHLDIIHGTGTGALKKAIRDYLETADDIASFHEPDADVGGPGMTVARLK